MIYMRKTQKMLLISIELLDKFDKKKLMISRNRKLGKLNFNKFINFLIERELNLDIYFERNELKSRAAHIQELKNQAEIEAKELYKMTRKPDKSLFEGS